MILDMNWKALMLGQGSGGERFSMQELVAELQRENVRLQLLVSELLMKNQQLREDS